MKMDEKFEYDKTYYFDRSGLTIEESEVKAMNTDCTPVVKACCRLQLPKGFKFSDCAPGMCFDLSDLTCIKSPLLQKVTLPTCECKHPVECEVVAGYEIRVIGAVNFSVSAPLSPICGSCFPVPSHTCCSKTEPVNEVVSFTCCPKPCCSKKCCVDWNFAFFTLHLVESTCGEYLVVNMGVSLELKGSCDCDDEK